MQIELRDFKGVTGSFTLARHTILIGPNGSGKTAILDALSFAVMGHTAIGKRQDDTMQIAGPTGCSVRVRLDV